MSSRHPATVRLSLEEFSRHGGLSGPHKDGWGIAWYEDRDVRVVKEALPAAASACVRFVQEHPPSSSFVVSHVRRATQGATAHANCQPFARELGGRMHVFAHNGHLAGIDRHPELQPGAFRPVGTTDSEQAFCALLERLRPLWLGTESVPPLEVRLATIGAFAAALRPLGPANFLYVDGDALFVHGHRRTLGPGRGFGPPGLHVLKRSCPGEPATLSAPGLEVRLEGPQEVLLAASVPLTDEAWEPLAEGEILVAASGRELFRVDPQCVKTA